MLKFNHSTKLQLAQRLRAIYKDPSTPGWKRVLIARYLTLLIANGDVTDAQIKAAFDGLTNPQLAALKTKLSNESALCDSVVAVQGQ